jgi:hypothetical protein
MSKKRILSDADFKKHGFVKIKTHEKHSFYHKTIKNKEFDISYSTKYNIIRMGMRLWGDQDRSDDRNTFYTTVLKDTYVFKPSDLKFIINHCVEYNQAILDA